MKIFKYLLVSAFLLLQASLCFARSENVINLAFLPDTLSHCHQYIVDVAVSKKSTLGALWAPECNSDRATYTAPNSQVKTQFNRMVIPWKYYMNGALEEGAFFMASVGYEQTAYQSVAGSVANDSFIVTGVHVGYHWFWKSGFNINLAVGVAHLVLNSVDKTIAATESREVVDFIDKNTSTNTHMGAGVVAGWAF